MSQLLENKKITAIPEVRGRIWKFLLKSVFGTNEKNIKENTYLSHVIYRYFPGNTFDSGYIEGYLRRKEPCTLSAMRALMGTRDFDFLPMAGSWKVLVNIFKTTHDNIKYAEIKGGEVMAGSEFPLAPQTQPKTEVKSNTTRNAQLDYQFQLMKFIVTESIKHHRVIGKGIFGNLSMDDYNYLKQYTADMKIFDYVMDDIFEFSAGLSKE